LRGFAKRGINPFVCAKIKKTPRLPRLCGVLFFDLDAPGMPGPNRTENEMNTQAKQRRTHFSEVEIGQKFFDLISAEYFVKQSDTTAVMVTGIGDGKTADEFEPDDVVRVEE
jgi:hypothetical protein